MAIKLAITGRFRRGKDTLANILIEHLGADKVQRLAFADALKDELAMIARAHLISMMGRNAPPQAHSWPEWRLWMREHRDLNGVGWQWLGEFMRSLAGESYWINHTRLQIDYDEAIQDGKHIIITDMRHHNECEWARKHGFYTVRVDGPNHSPDDVRDVDHPSERDIPHLDVHTTIANTSTISWLEVQTFERLLPRVIEYCACVEATEPLVTEVKGG